MGESGETLDLCRFDARDEPLFRPRGVQAWFPDQLAPRPAEQAAKRPKTAKFAGSQRRDHVKYPVPIAFRRKCRSCGRR